jgi:phage terminase large subunit-like protein
MASPKPPAEQQSVPRALLQHADALEAAHLAVDPRKLDARTLHVVGEIDRAGDRIAAALARRRATLFSSRYPDTGPLRRELYVDHLAFFAAGALHKERIFLAANRIGKTEAAAYEVTCHMTGLYPAWWTGKRFDGPTKWWFAGDTMEMTRNVQQQVLLGPHEDVPEKHWSGMIPPHLVTYTTRRSGAVANCIGSLNVRHVSGLNSSAEFKSYDQGRKSFQGTAVNIWFDEEPPSAAESKDDLYSEILIRTMTIDGCVILTYTPLEGLTPFINRYIDTAVMWDPDQQAYASARDVLFPKDDRPTAPGPPSAGDP